MNKKQLQEIKARVEAANPDAYSKDRMSLSFTPQEENGTAAVWYDDGDLCAEIHDNLGLGIFDPTAWAELFAHTTTDIPVLIAEVERLQAQLHEAQKIVKFVDDLISDEVLYKDEDDCIFCGAEAYEDGYHHKKECWTFKLETALQLYKIRVERPESGA